MQGGIKMSETVKVRIDAWRPASLEQVRKLFGQGWEVDEVLTEKHQSCHEPTVASDQTVFYILRKKANHKINPGVIE
jgi:hypothetical protein